MNENTEQNEGGGKWREHLTEAERGTLDEANTLVAEGKRGYAIIRKLRQRCRQREWRSREPQLP